MSSGMSALPKVEDHRSPDHPIEPLIWQRWSPRAMSGEPVAEADLLACFEAARWAPSTYNEQEWRFLFARRGEDQWPHFFDLLAGANQAWAKNAGVLVVVLAAKTFARNGKPNPVHLYDVGAAWQNAALQATALGLVAHGMSGFDYERAAKDLGVPDDFAVAAMFALGHPGDPNELPEDYQEIEKPSGRRPVSESICEGQWAF